MKYIIASDLHGSAYWCKELLDVFEKEGADKLILLGDLLYHGPRNDFPQDYSPRKVFEMLNAIKDKIICVR
ncbi:MAG: metallophosphoesterase family protein, partial [Clostridia bacterium]|nr:metallophosphoesterase family protein [Clostridia bacterium]